MFSYVRISIVPKRLFLVIEVRDTSGKSEETLLKFSWDFSQMTMEQMMDSMNGKDVFLKGLSIVKGRYTFALGEENILVNGLSRYTKTLRNHGFIDLGKNSGMTWGDQHGLMHFTTTHTIIADELKRATEEMKSSTF